MLSSELIAKVKRIEITAKRLVSDLFAGEYHSVFKGMGMEFDELVPYNPGDDVRRIDWNVTARMAAPYVRRYQEERELTVMLAVDASGSSDFGTVGQPRRELAAELAAVLSLAATANQDRVGLMMFTDRVELLTPPRKGRRHILRIVRDLLAFREQSRGTDIGFALDTVSKLLKRRSVVFLISDFIAPPESYSRELAVAAGRHDVIAVDVYDPGDRDIPRVGIVALEDAETGDLVWVDTDSDSWRRSFEENIADHEVCKSGMMRSLGVDRIEIATGEEYVGALNEFFRSRARKIRR